MGDHGQGCFLCPNDNGSHTAIYFILVSMHNAHVEEIIAVRLLDILQHIFFWVNQFKNKNFKLFDIVSHVLVTDMKQFFFLLLTSI